MRPAYPPRGRGCNPLVCGRRHCTACGRWRHGLDFACNRREPLMLAGRCRTCMRRQQRAARRDPQRGELRREYQRIWAEGKRRRLGIPARHWQRGRLYKAPSAKWTVPAEPIRRLVTEQLRYEDARTLARRAGVTPRLLHRLLHEAPAGLSVAAADRLAVALGLHLDLIYSQEVTL
jgi:hypothetical protein